ncbi:hypothetical protein D5085_16800 [Ectothiorhodospiraceae bacterium BW-2]|nr:hypothetical protein D5085_16800 [Ectothiorhodospiraceae bacterium BW-2]
MRLDQLLQYTTAVVLLGWSALALALGDAVPVTLLTQVEGSIEHSRDGETWRQVRRNKLLFAGHFIRSGADGGGQFINQQNGQVRRLLANSEIKITAAGAEAVVGELPSIDGVDTRLLDSLQKRFAKAQRYTTVRRAVIHRDRIDLQVPREITLSHAYPELVWESVGSDYRYRLTIGEQQFDIPATSEALVRYRIEGIKPGNYGYKVELLQGDEVIFSPEREGSVRWMGDSEWQQVAAELDRIDQQLGGDSFFKASLLEEQGLFVAAMDNYSRYFADNPDGNDLRPMYIQLLHALKLKQLRMVEAEIYNRQLAQ